MWITFTLSLFLSNGLDEVAWQKVRVNLTTPRTGYLLGEPVRLDIAVENVTQGPIKLREALETEIRIYLSHDGKVFRKFSMDLPGTEVARPTETLQPGESWRCRLRVLCSAYSGALAFERPGVYFVRCDYQFIPYGTGISEWLSSQVVKVSISAPTGEDAKVWRKLQDREFRLAGLQTGLSPSKATARKLVELLEQFPQTGYAESFRTALRRFYFSQRSQVSLEERAKIRQLTGITDVYEFKDPRLDSKIEQRFPSKDLKIHATSVGLPLESLLKMLQEQSEVPLDAPSQLKRRSVGVWTRAVPGWGKPPVNLREYMDEESVTDRLHAWWVRRGQGYVLVREEDLEQKPATPKQPRPH